MLILFTFCVPSRGVTEAQASSGCSGGMEGCEKPVLLPSLSTSLHHPSFVCSLNTVRFCTVMINTLS